MSPLYFGMEGSFWEETMQLILLSDQFYLEHPESDFPEIMKKDTRPYYCVAVKIYDTLFAIPLRHNIKHPYAFCTIENAGLDFTKAVIIDKPEYISAADPWIDSKEQAVIRSNEGKTLYKFTHYLAQYKRALKHPDNPRSQRLLLYNTLNYYKELFEEKDTDCI